MAWLAWARLGRVHANNIAYKIPNAELTAACSIVPEELEYAKSHLGVTDVYADFREMLEKADIDASIIVTTSSEHCWQYKAALDEANTYLQTKPLGVDESSASRQSVRLSATQS